MIEKSIPLWSKKLTRLSISCMVSDPVENTVGIPTSATFSRSGQSFAEQLATLIKSKPILNILSTEDSSNGVHIDFMPDFRTAFNRVSKSFHGISVERKRFTILWSLLRNSG